MGYGWFGAPSVPLSEGVRDGVTRYATAARSRLALAPIGCAPAPSGAQGGFEQRADDLARQVLADLMARDRIELQW